MLEIFVPPSNLAPDLIKFFHRQPCHDLSEVGSRREELKVYVGVYALYYFGELPIYQPLRQVNEAECRVPIYIGKASPEGRRTGAASGTATNNLYSRLREHYRSISLASNLDVRDFKYKVVAMDIDLVAWGEATLIREFSAIWNRIISGFGIHAPGVGRKDQARSMWDQLHPGRGFAGELPNPNVINEEDLRRIVAEHCEAAIKALKRDLSSEGETSSGN